MGIPTKVPIDLVNPTPAASTDLSNYVTLDTVQSITNKKSFYHIIINSDGSWQNGFKFINPKLTTDDPPSSSAFNTINYYGADNVRTGCVENYVSTTNDTFTKLVAIQHSSAASGSCELGVKVLADGAKQTFAPTPATTDNSTQIATTAFVNNRLPYSTGTWTPTLSGSTTAGAFTYTSNTGTYIKIGKLVFIYGYISISECTALPAGIVLIKGLPFTSKSSTGTRANSIWARCNGLDNTSAKKIVAFFINANSTNLSARTLVTNDTIGIDGFNEVEWSTSSTTGKYVKVTVQSYTGQGISFSGVYETA